MDIDSLFRFYSLCLILFFSLGIYLFERKQQLFGYACIIIGFFILAGLSILFESLAMELLALGIATALICKLIWEKALQKFVGFFMLSVFYSKIRRLIRAKAKNPR